MVEIDKDKKSSTWVLTKTDGEGYHHQMHLSGAEVKELQRLLNNAEA